MQNKLHKFEPQWLVFPSEILDDHLSCLEISDEIFEKSVGVSKKDAFEQFDSLYYITSDIASAVGSLTNLPSEFWKDLQQNYTEHATRIRDDFLFSKYTLSDETISKLEKVFDVPTDFFINLKENTSAEKLNAYLNYAMFSFRVPNSSSSEHSYTEALSKEFHFIMPDFDKLALKV